jgi:hypothetical protein
VLLLLLLLVLVLVLEAISDQPEAHGEWGRIFYPWAFRGTGVSPVITIRMGTDSRNAAKYYSQGQRPGTMPNHRPSPEGAESAHPPMSPLQG